VFGRKRKNVAVPASLMERQPDDDTSNISIATSNLAAGYLCGSLSRINIFEGGWDQAICEKVYLSGISNIKGLKSLGIETREVFAADPLDFIPGRSDSSGNVSSLA